MHLAYKSRKPIEPAKQIRALLVFEAPKPTSKIPPIDAPPVVDTLFPDKACVSACAYESPPRIESIRKYKTY